MRISTSIELIVNLATRETIASEFKEVRPDHVFAGILKFSEIDIATGKELFKDPAEFEIIKKELADVRALLAKKSWDSTSLRRQIRKALGKGGFSFKGDVIHRSSETRRIFERAQAFCVKENAGFFTAIYLLHAFLESPSPVMAKLLGIESGPRVFNTRDARKMGISGGEYKERDLLQMAFEGEIKPAKERMTQALALKRHAFHSMNKPVLLISEDDALARECVETMACDLAAHQDQDEVKQRKWKVVEICPALPKSETDPRFKDQLRRIIVKASEVEIDVLVLKDPLFSAYDHETNHAFNILSEIITSLERPPCVMVFTSVSGAGKIREREEGPLNRCHRVFLDSGINILLPLGIPANPIDIAPSDLGSACFNKKSQVLKHHLVQAWAGGVDNTDEISIRCFLASAVSLNKLGITLSQFLGITKRDIQTVLNEAPGGFVPPAIPIIPFSEPAKKLLTLASELASEQPDNEDPGMVDIRHVAGAMSLTAEICSFLKVSPCSREEVLEMLDELFVGDLSTVSIGELTSTLKALGEELTGKIFGQDHAIHAFVDGLFNAEVVATAERERKKPKGVFLFAGPPGVGKTFLAECGAKALDRPFERFDMSSYSDHNTSVHLLAGTQRSYQGAHEGRLTRFVNKNPQSVLLFDEIEKAHLNVIHLFLQILDQGILEDQFTEENVSFKDTIIIFTTNAGKQLYDDPNASGVHAANADFHRKTILSALENEKDQRTGNPFFPQAIISRIATGYPLMFNHLGVNELHRIASSEMKQMGGVMEKQYYKEVEFTPLVPMCIVLREGANTDARTIRSQAEGFVKSEIFKFFRLFKSENLDSIMDDIDKIVFDLDTAVPLPDDMKALMEPEKKPEVLLVADEPLCELWSKHISTVEWAMGSDKEDILSLLNNKDVDLVLLDLWIGKRDRSPQRLAAAGETLYRFDHTPAAATVVKQGQELLRAIHERHPEIPCFLLLFKEGGNGGPGMDDELFQACVRSGGARGVIESSFLSLEKENWEEDLSGLSSSLEATTKHIYREKKARELGAQRKILAFDTAPQVSAEERSVVIRVRNLRLASAMAASDVSEILQDIDRPTSGFADVYGADAAKTELQYIVKWLKNPRRFNSMGLRPPKGILLYGPPGTGKTMLARALAGECNVTFIVESATNFVTKYVGTGPENVRNLFARARRYAPTILFIDEIDAIGKKRTGGGHGGTRAYEETLNSILTEMDGFDNSSKNPVIVIAATNLVEHLDSALLRRFDRDIEVDKPDRDARRAYLKKRLQGKTGRDISDEVVKRLSGQSANMTIAELERIVELAGRMASDDGNIITDAIIEEAFERMRMGDLKGETDPETLLRVARHEAGHCLIGWLRGEKPVQITIVARGKAGGFVEREADEDKMIYARSDLEGMIRQAMGGRAAEIVYYGDENGLTTGVSGDLKTATRYAESMVRDYGMGRDVGQVAIDPSRLRDGPLAIKVMEGVERIVKGQLDLAIAELESHRDSLDRLVDQLMEKNRLTRADLDSILDIH